jgi:hypothetical protein
MKIAIAVAAIAALAVSVPPGADARVRHDRTRTAHVARHLRAYHHPAGVIYGEPVYLGPGERPGYRYGGPLYSTCDRINADRMLVGTCR